MKDIDLQYLVKLLKKLANRLRPYIGVLFFLLFAGVYGFIVLQINALSNAPVDDTAVSSQVKNSAVPRIDAKAIKQLEALKDNSVNVQTLFETGRTNPFQE